MAASLLRLKPLLRPALAATGAAAAAAAAISAPPRCEEAPKRVTTLTLRVDPSIDPEEYTCAELYLHLRDNLIRQHCAICTHHRCRRFITTAFDSQHDKGCAHCVPSRPPCKVGQADGLLRQRPFLMWCPSSIGGRFLIAKPTDATMRHNAGYISGVFCFATGPWQL